MPANHKVSVSWQILFTFITGLNFWAFYRIRKLQKYLLFVFAPSIAASMVLFAMIYDRLHLGPGDPYDFVALGPVEQIFPLVSLGFQALAIYLVIIWSREHNRMFDMPLS